MTKTDTPIGPVTFIDSDAEDRRARREMFGELTDPFTGERFYARAPNHYEDNDGVPVAPHVDVKRPTVRQRIENLLHRGVDPLANYVGSEGVDMDIPDDPEAELTPSERNYLDQVASDLAEQAPLPDEGMPRPAPEPAPGAVSPPAAASGAPPAAPAAGEGGRPPPAAGPAAPVPTR